MDIMIITLAVTIFIQNSCSQILSKSPPCYSNGDALTLHCETADFTQTITFVFNTVDQGGCIPGLGCAPGISQSGNTTSMTISPFSNSAHNGSWTCSYGISTSAALIINDNPCVETTVGSLEGTTSNTTSTTTQSNTTQKPTKQWCGLVDHCIGVAVGCVLGFVTVLIIIAVCYFKRKN